MLLAKYEEDFSTHTLKCFMEEYMAVQSLVNDEEQRLSIQKMQEKFSITSVKGEDSVHLQLMLAIGLL